MTGIEHEAEHLIGYPCNDAFDYSELAPLWNHTINNVGDPFIESSYRLNTHSIEREVIKFFAELFHLKDDESWGYVTHGGTEGNMYGMYLAREMYPQGMGYYCEDTHYSVQKLLRLIGLHSIMNEITVITENHPGIVGDILEITAKADINVEQIDAEVVGNYGIMHLVADQYDKAVHILHNAGYNPLTAKKLIKDILVG